MHHPCVITAVLVAAGVLEVPLDESHAFAVFELSTEDHANELANARDDRVDIAVPTLAFLAKLAHVADTDAIAQSEVTEISVNDSPPWQPSVQSLTCKSLSGAPTLPATAQTESKRTRIRTKFWEIMMVAMD